MNTSGSFSLKRSWKSTSGSDTYDEISTKRLKIDYVSGIGRDHIILSNPIIGPPDPQLYGNEKPGQLRFIHYDDAQRGLLQVYDGSEWLSLNDFGYSSLWYLLDNMVNVKNNYKVNLTNDLILNANFIPKLVSPNNYMKTDENGKLVAAPNSTCLSTIDQSLSKNSDVEFKSLTISPASMTPNNYIKTNENGKLDAAPNSEYLSTIDQSLSKNSHVEFKSLTISPAITAPNYYIKTNENGRLVGAPNSGYLSVIDQSLSKDSDVQFKNLTISPISVATNKYIKTNENGRLVDAPNSTYLSTIDQSLSKNSDVEFKSLTISPSTQELKIKFFDSGSYGMFGIGKGPYQLNYHVDTNGGSHVFYAGGSNGDGIELFRITGSGNIGIVEYNPTYPLCVIPRVNGPKICLRLPDGFEDGMFGLSITDRQMNFHVTDTTLNNFVFYRGGTGAYNTPGGTELVRIKGNGDLNILGSFGTISSKRYKSNIQNISNSIMNELLNIGIKEYDFFGDKKIGIIAEDVYDSMPNLRDYLVTYKRYDDFTNEEKQKIEDKYKITKDNEIFVVDGINTSTLIYLLIGIVKQQQNEINNLKNQISRLEENNQNLINTVELLKNSVQELINTINNLPQNQ